MPTARNATPARGFPGDEDYEPGDNGTTVGDLLGPSIPAVSFPEIGATVTGVILSTEVGIQTEPGGEVKTWDDGQPRRQVVITIQTALAVDEDDDGQRRLFVKGGMTRSFRAEMRRAKVREPLPGGELTVTYIGDGPVAKKGQNAPKLYDVTYVAP